jgi:hypothetical protein
MRRILILFGTLLISILTSAQNVFTVNGNKTYLNDKGFQPIGLRCANALISDKSVNELINYLDEYKTYGLNTISVYYMGSRCSNVYGFNLDGTIDKFFQTRMEKIVEACDKRNMVVLVGILYWGGGETGTHYKSWTQAEVNSAMRNTVKWLLAKNYKNVFIDPDNEGMAEIAMHFNIDEMIREGKKIAPAIPIAYNGTGNLPSCADLTIHFGAKTQHLPYIETEGTPGQYWGDYSKEKGLNEYINVGIYSKGKKEQQLNDTKDLLDKGYGYLFASTWLQNIPPNYNPGGDGSPCNPGIKWWCDFIKENYKKND